MSYEYTISFENQIKYTGKQIPSIATVADSLHALDIYSKKLPKFMNTLMEAEIVWQSEAQLQSITQGSLIKDIWTHLVFGSETERKEFLDKLRDMRVKDAMNLKWIVPAVIGGGAVLGVQWMLDRSPEATAEQKLQVEQNYGTIIQIGSENSGLDPDYLDDAIRRSMPTQRQNIINAKKLLAPARDNEGEGIIVGDDEALIITPESIRSTPFDAEFEESETSRTFENVEVELRAHDLDKQTGWAAIVPAISKARKKLEVHPNINTESLFQQKTITGTITAFYTSSEGRKKTLKSYFLDSVSE